MKTNTNHAKKVLVALFAMLLPLVASAEKVEIDGIWYNLVSKAKQAEVTYKGDDPYYYNDYSGSITIPATVTHNGVEYSVTSIGESAFAYCSSLTSINIPEGVTYIGEGAFEGCRNLTSITIPEGVTSIGDYAFFQCSSLTAITIPEGVTSIGSSAFDGCSSLTAVHISSIEAWCNISFRDYSSNPFYYAHNLYVNGELVTELVIPEGVTSIGDDAFYKCSSLTSITIPEGVTSIGESAFAYCSSLTSITIPEGVTSIGNSAFDGCSSLTSITIPEGVTSIGNYAFQYCSSLTSITLPEGVTSIGSSAFWGCSSLTAITIPESVMSIGSSAFGSCSSLTSITLPEGVTTIGDRAFYKCSSLTAINIPENSQLTSIGERAFSGCSSLTAITIPESVTSIGEDAFEGCSSLTSINIPEGVTSIGSSAFSGCSSLTAVHISSIEAWCNISFRDYSSNPLYYAHNLYVNGELVTELVIPEGVTTIGERAFSGCTGLTAITIPEGVTSIGGGAFYKCSSLTSINIPENSQLTEINGSAFSGCNALKELTLGKSLRTIEDGAFSSSTALEKVTIYATRPPTANANNIFSDETYQKATLYVPQGCADKYQVMTGWSAFNNISEIAVAVASITLNHSSATLTEGELLTLTATITPDDATDKTVTWSSSDLNVATIDGTGTITAIAPGTATITATANDGSGVSTQCEVTVGPRSYTLTFLVDDEVFHTDTLIRGTAIVAPEVPEKEGYTFSGWGEVPETMPAEDVTIEGIYSINSYTLTYMVDGDVVLTLPIAYGATIPSLKAPEKEGYTFSGWSKAPETMPAEDVTITGTFKRLPSIYLTINQADNGCVKQHLVVGIVCAYTIEAAEGWKIHTVTFNGEDVTSQLTEEGTFTTPALQGDAVLNIAYEKIDDAISHAQASRIKVQGHQGIISISGTTEGTDISLYTTDGTLVTRETAEGESTHLTVPTGQVYIVKVADAVVKIGM